MKPLDKERQETANAFCAVNGAHFPASSSGWWFMAGIVLFATVIPVVTFLLAAWLFAERLESVTLIGGTLILVAVVLLTRSEIAQSKPQKD